jgi:hypothetical protein
MEINKIKIEKYSLLMSKEELISLMRVYQYLASGKEDFFNNVVKKEEINFINKLNLDLQEINFI